MDTYPEFTANVEDESNLLSYTEIGDDYTEIGDAQTEIGDAYNEIGGDFVEMSNDLVSPFETFSLGPTKIGDGFENPGFEEGGYSDDPIDRVEIGKAEAIRAVVKKARDNRQPPPKMQAVDVDAPPRDEEDEWALTDTFIGAAEATGTNLFPVLSQLMIRFGANTEPRIVRVDTEESYKAFRAQSSPDVSELHEQIAEVSERLSAHEEDPFAHMEMDRLTELGEEIKKVEDSKQVHVWLPQRFDGKYTAWIEGDNVCASLVLPGSDGNVRICTALEPIEKCIEEMSRHASEANVPASTIVGCIDEMGVILGAGTVMKEIAAAAPAILKRPEESKGLPFMVRIEPKASPTLCALAALANECRNGNQQACNEWNALANSAPAQIKQAMNEAIEVLKKAA